MIMFSHLTLVSTVKIPGSGVVTATHGSNIKLKCDVSGNDTFEAWKNPDNIVVVNSKKVVYTVSGNSHEIKIIDVEAEDGGNWTCTSKEGNSDTTELHVAGALRFAIHVHCMLYL